MLCPAANQAKRAQALATVEMPEMEVERDEPDHSFSPPGTSGTKKASADAVAATTARAPGTR